MNNSELRKGRIAWEWHRQMLFDWTAASAANFGELATDNFECPSVAYAYAVLAAHAAFEAVPELRGGK